MTRSKTFSIAAALATVVAAQTADAGTYTFNASADAHVQSDATTTNYGTGTRMNVDGSPQAQVAMRFAVSGISGTVTSAKLRLYVNNPTSDGPAVFRSTNTTWSESSVNWNTRPALAGSALANLGAL